MTTLCRQCGHIEAVMTKGRCPVCRSPRRIQHPELAELSIAHIDWDAFYAAIEKRDNPDLADKPVIIGGGRRGVVSTACYVARRFGVRSAMPMFKALIGVQSEVFWEWPVRAQGWSGQWKKRMRKMKTSNTKRGGCKCGMQDERTAELIWKP